MLKHSKQTIYDCLISINMPESTILTPSFEVAVLLLPAVLLNLIKIREYVKIFEISGTKASKLVLCTIKVSGLRYL